MLTAGKNHPRSPVLPADAVVLGEAVVDLLPEVPGTPLEQAERFTRHVGGAGANLAVGLSRQGVKTALVTMVGADPFGRFLVSSLAQDGVATDGISTHKSARTGICFGALGPRGERTFLAYRQPSADQLLSPADFQPAHIARGRLLCLGAATLVLASSRTATERAIEIGRAAGQIVFCDLNYRPHQFSDLREAPGLVRRLLGQCDVVKLCEPELLSLFGTESVEAAAQKARALGPAIVVVTRGEKGCYLSCGEGSSHLVGEMLRQPVLDPSGAGDAFSAGLVSTLLGELGARSQGDGKERLLSLSIEVWKRACVRGNQLGAKACTHAGATTALPRGPS